jgi:hypothetical protein
MRLRLLPVVLVSLTACRQTTSPADDLTASAAVMPAGVRAGETVTVRITVTNSGSEPRRISTSTCRAPFVVADRAGKFVGPVPVGTCSLIDLTKELAPGEEHVFTLPWTADVAPGTYRLRARVAGPDRLVGSPPATIGVTP